MLIENADNLTHHPGGGAEMKKIFLLGLPILMVMSGVFLYKNTSVAKSTGRTKDQIYDIHKEYVESTYGPDVDFRIMSYGESGIGYVNHETGEVIWHIEDMDY